jgi:hypothetical protein
MKMLYPKCESENVDIGHIPITTISGVQVTFNSHYRWCKDCDYKWYEVPEIKLPLDK